MTTQTRYAQLARSANHIALLLRRLGGDGSHWKEVRARWMALARQERGSAQLYAMVAAVVLLGAPAVVLDIDRDDSAQSRLDEVRVGNPFTLGEPLVPATFDEEVDDGE